MDNEEFSIMFATMESNFCIHFIGIGGIGMSGIAEIMHSLGYRVKGSDISRSANTDRLERLGISVGIGHSEDNVKGANIIVFSSAVKSDNIELSIAKKLGIPILTRAEMLSQLVRFKKSIVIAGSHGKTTVTSLCSSILELAAFNPTIINGGIINAYQTNAKLGTGEWAVIESDESDGSFVKIFPTIGIVTNIDKEHINYYGSFEVLKNSFCQFLENLPFFGFGIVCVDDQSANEIALNINNRKIITYSIHAQSMFRAVNIRGDRFGASFDVQINFDCNEETVTDFRIGMLGEHNILNALSAISMAYVLKIDMNTVKSALSGFMGVNRRFTHIGNINGIEFIDDYAHHPTEIKTVLDSANQFIKNGKQKIIICQPHRFTRLLNLFTEFVSILSEFNKVIVMPVYKADDTEVGQRDSKDLYNALSLKLKENAIFCEKEEYLCGILQNLMDSRKIDDGDIVVFAGAGSISKIGRSVIENLK